jgi:hypothetical protein
MLIHPVFFNLSNAQTHRGIGRDGKDDGRISAGCICEKAKPLIQFHSTTNAKDVSYSRTVKFAMG